MSEEEKTGIIRFEAGTVAGALNSRVMNIVQRADQEGESQQLEAQAREIFEEDFIGVEEVENALDVNISRNIVPQIPFTEGELVVAQKRGQRLVLRISHINDKPLTMQSLNTHVQRIFDEEEMGKVLYLEKWYKDDPFFTEMVPETRWALVTNGALEGSLDMNYLEQTQLIVEYFKEGLFEGVKLPSKYANAIAEFEMQRGAIERLMEVDDDEYQKKSNRKTNKT